jgi:hypothetical protein
MLKITKANEVILTSNLVVVLFGQPGSGKSSMAFSAAKPLMLDFDNGAQRSIGRKDAVRISNWSDVESIVETDLVDYDTIVVDTVGRLLECLIQSLGKRDPKLVRKTGELTLQGYGALAVAYKAWIAKVKSFGKDLILISHEKEEKNGDNTYIRLDVAGSTKNEILKMADLLGYLSMDGNKRVLDFNPTEFHLGKNCAGFELLHVPDYTENQNFLAELVAKAKDKMNAKSDEAIKAEAEFNAAIERIIGAKNADEFNQLMSDSVIQKIPALKKQLVKVAESVGIIFNKVHKCFINQTQQEQQDVITNGVNQTTGEIEGDFDVNPDAAAAAENEFA